MWLVLGDQSGDLLTWMNVYCFDWPETLKMRAIPERGEQSTEGLHRFLRLNRRHRKALERAKTIVLNLFSGGTKTVQFGDVGSGVVILNIDAVTGRDLLNDSAYAWLATLCASGKVCAVLSKPPSGSFREWGSDPRHSYIRGRSHELRFGMHENTQREQLEVDQQSLLVLRSLVLHHLADEARAEGCMLALEHPQDPLRTAENSDNLTSSTTSAKLETPSLWSWPIFENRLRQQEGR